MLYNTFRDKQAQATPSSSLQLIRLELHSFFEQLREVVFGKPCATVLATDDNKIATSPTADGTSNTNIGTTTATIMTKAGHESAAVAVVVVATSSTKTTTATTTSAITVNSTNNLLPAATISTVSTFLSGSIVVAVVFVAVISWGDTIAVNTIAIDAIAVIAPFRDQQH